MNWQNFQNHGEPPATAFEAFATQLFERWCMKTYAGRLRQVYALDGAGGDGGVEAFAVLDDGTEIGLQAKWFHDKINASRIGKIAKSLKQAHTRHPRMTRYIVCLPNDLKDSKKTTKAKKKQESEVDRWSGFVKAAAGDAPGVAIEYWGKTKLEELLAASDDGSLAAYWFAGHALKPADFAAVFRATLASQFSERYIPELHQLGRIDTALRDHLRTADIRARVVTMYQNIRRTFQSAKIELERLPRLTLAQLDSAEARKMVAELLAYIGHVLPLIDRHEAEIIAGTLSSTASADGSSVPNFPPSLDPLMSLLKEIDEKGEFGRAPSHSCRTAMSKVTEAGRLLVVLEQRAHAATLPLVIDGPPGVGKTHGVVAFADVRVNKGLPVLLVAGRDAKPGDGLGALLGKAVQHPGLSTAAILNALEGAAHITDRKRSSGKVIYGVAVEPCRALILIDGLEESADSSKWPSRLKELVELTRTRPRLKLAVTTREATLEQCVGALTQVSDNVSLRSAADVSMPTLFASYCKHYAITVEGNAWLPWALATPLAVRLFAELYKGQVIRTGTELVTRIPVLLKAKIERIESELRALPHSGWAREDSLLLPALQTLVRAIVDGDGALSRKDAIVAIQKCQAPAGVMTHERASAILERCRVHGILDGWERASADPLASGEWVYRPALNTITDYLLARDVHAGLGAGPLPAAAPAILEGRGDCASLVVSMLAMDGRIAVSEGLWRENVPAAKLDRWQLRSILDLPADRAAGLADWVRAKFTRSMSDCRAVLGELVMPAARLPSHAFGAHFVDALLRPLGVAERDVFWSGPDRLPRNCNRPWEGASGWPLDGVELVDVDEPDGLPLLMAWSLSSLVKKRRTESRTKLARWGAKSLRKMAALLERMATVNDPQVVEDLFTAAAGSAISCGNAASELVELAAMCDKLLFARGATAYTTNVVTRHAARTVIERAHLLGLASAEMVGRARPPYAPAGSDPLPYESGEEDDGDRRHILDWDLRRYVARNAYSEFFEEYLPPRAKDETRALEEVDGAVLRSAAATLPAAAAELAAREEERASLTFKVTMTMADELEAAGVPVSDVEPRVDSDAEFEEIVKKLAAAQPKSRLSEPAAALLRTYAAIAGAEALKASDLVEGMIVARVKSFGWTGDRFYGAPNGGEPGEVLGADIAVIRVYTPETHGSRSQVASFREKYVFQAVNEIAGYFADRLPRGGYDEASGARMCLDYGELGAGMADPLVSAIDEEVSNESADAAELWLPPGLFQDLPLPVPQDQKAHAIEWIQKAPLPKLAAWRYCEEGRAIILAATIGTADPKSLAQERIWISTFAAAAADMQRLRADLARGAMPGVVRGDQMMCSLGHATYTNPSIACWAPWLEPLDEERRYVSLDPNGNPVPITLRTLVAKGMWEVPGVGENEVWMPGPVLRQDLMVTSSKGNHEHRLYLDRADAVVAEFTKWNSGNDSSRWHSMLTADSARVAEVMAKRGWEIAWYVHHLRSLPVEMLDEESRGLRRDFYSVVFADGQEFTQEGK